MKQRAARVRSETTMNNHEYILEPDQLEAGAVVPQCLDNQYVPSEVFKESAERFADFSDSDIKSAKDIATRSEYIRSLVYSSQVVVNRAFFPNNPVIWQDLPNHPNVRANRDAYMHLLRRTKE